MTISRVHARPKLIRWCTNPIRIGLWFLFAIVLWGCGGGESAPTPRHLVVITIDTLRADRLGCYGYHRDLTPQMDRIAQEGTRMAQATAPITCTGPSHTSLFTGLYPLGHGMTSNFMSLAEDVETLAEILSENGYSTGAFFNTFPFHKLNVIQGFDQWAISVRDDAQGLTDALDQWLDKSEPAERRFIWMHFFCPHAPANSPREHQKKWITHPYNGPLDQSVETLDRIRKGIVKPTNDYVLNFRDGYDADVAFSDLRVGEVLELLRAKDLLEESLLIVASDHGESLERGIIGLHSPVIRQATVHVPLLMRGPGIPAGRVVEQVVGLVDVFPTVLECLGVPIPQICQGRSFLRLVCGGDSEWQEQAISMVPTEYIGRKVPGYETDPSILAVRDRDWKLVRRGQDTLELYNLRIDAEELSNQASKHPGIVRRLQSALDDWLATVKRPQDVGKPLGDAELEFLRSLGYVQ